MKINTIKNAKRNMIWGFVYKIVMLLLPFVSRTVILKILGEQYLGLNSLFSSILQILNLADLGFGTAIVYSMYKPIAEDNSEEICALLNLYKRIYRVVGCIVLGSGLALMPFLRNLIKGDTPPDINIHLVYLAYLINTVLSYWLFAYKGSLLTAHQREDVMSRVSSFVILVQYIFQIGFLVITRNYYAFLVVLPIMTLVKNIVISITVDKTFPNYKPRGTVDREKKSELKKQVGGLFISKVCGTTRNALDSVFLSMFLGLTTVAMYGNYYYLLNSVHQFVGVFNTSMLGGIGNSIARETEEKNYVNFNRLLFIFSWIIGWCTCCLICLYQHFMRIWVGESLLFNTPIVILFSLYFYAMGSTDIKNIYVDATGLWWENKNRSVVETIVNLVGNYTLGMLFGVYGIIVATLVSIILINNVFGTHILFKHYFKNESLFKYFQDQFHYFIICLIACLITYWVCSLLPEIGIGYFLVKIIICVILPNIVFYVSYCRSSIFKSCVPVIKTAVLSKLKPISK